MQSSTTHTIRGLGLTLADLRSLVDKTKDAPADTPISMKSVRYNHPTDPGEDSISVTVRS